MTTVTTFPCPGCGEPVVSGAPRCEACRLWLVGPLAAQLWQIDQHLLNVQAQRARLVDDLRVDEPRMRPYAGGTGRRPAGDVWAAAPSTPRPTPRPAPRPGVETRTLLLGLGAVCLVAALVAGTALIWSSLGAGGQAAVMLMITAALLVGAVRLERLPATAEALAAVGVASLAIDLVAGRTLGLGALSDLDPRSYWTVGAVLAAGVLGAVAVTRPRLVSPTLGATLAVFGGVLAVVDPTSADMVALAAVLDVLVALVLVRVSGALRMHAQVLRGTAVGVGAVAAFVATVTSLVAAQHRGAGAWCGAALAVVLALRPGLAGRDWPLAAQRAPAVGGGLLLAALALVADVLALHSQPLALAVAAAAAMAAALLLPGRPVVVQRLCVGAGSAAALVAVVAETVLQQEAANHSAFVAAGLGVAALAAVASVLAVRVTEPTRTAAAGLAAALVVAAVAEVAASQGGRVSAVWAATVAGALCVVALAVHRLVDRPELGAPADAVAAVGAVGSAVALIALGDWLVSLGTVAGVL